MWSIWYICRLRRQQFISNDISNVIKCRKIDPRDSASGFQDVFCDDFNIVWQWILEWEPLRSRNCPGLQGQDIWGTTAYSQAPYSGDCTWGSVVCNVLNWKIDIPLSCCQYWVIEIHWRWNCYHNPLAEVTLIYRSRNVSVIMQNGLLAVQWFSRALECQLTATMLEIRLNGWTIPSWTPSAHWMWYHPSLPAADLQ